MERFIIFSVFISVFIVSCNESRDTISKIEMERYTECPIGEISQIALQGSGDYEINVEDASILNINYSQNTLTINPIAKGITKISVYDKITKNIANSTVKITDAYCTFQVGNPVRPPFSSSVYVYMVYNCTNDLYMFDNNFNLIENGHYLFEKTNEKYSLTFSFNNIYNGVNKLQLDLNNNNPTLLKNLESLLANHTLAESTYKARSENQIVLNAKNKENNIVYYLIFKKKRIPYYFLN